MTAIFFSVLFAHAGAADARAVSETERPAESTASVLKVADELAAAVRARVQRRFTNIWKKEPGAWRLYARHANVIAAR